VIRQRFSLGNLFYKGSRKLKTEESVDSMDDMDNGDKRDSMDFEGYEDEDLSQQDGQQKMLTMKDQETMMQELKKENFDLKLRLYMTQKNGESAEGKASEYEQQLSVLLTSLEEQQRLADQQSRELQEVRSREKALKSKQKRLEKVTQEQDEKIHELSINLSKVYSSMGNLNESPAHSTPMRNAKSSYLDDNDDDNRAINKSNVSHVAPMRRGISLEPSQQDKLLEHDRGVHHSVSEGVNYQVTNNSYNNSYDNRSNENVGVVRPNNSRTVLDVEYSNDKAIANTPGKKKKKGIMKMFGLCTGKSGQQMARTDSMYHKKEPAKITVTTYNNDGQATTYQ